MVALTHACGNCGFTCMSKKLFEMHTKHCDLGLTEKEERKIMQEQIRGVNGNKRD